MDNGARLATGVIQVCGRSFTLDGQPIRLRGLGVGSWLNLEHFMLGIPGWDGTLRLCLNRYCEHFMDRFTQSFFTIEDARYLRSLGVNLIRVPINHHLFWNDEQDSPNEYGFAQLERLAALCEEAGLYFLPDLHTTPGGQNPDWHSESTAGIAQFWQFQVFRKRAARIWGEIASRLWRCPALLGYDLLNEPVLPEGGGDMLNDFYRDAIAAIRKEDPSHIVFLEGDRFSMDFSSILQPADDNWAYAYHFYPGVWDERLLDPGMAQDDRKRAFAAALEEIIRSMGAYRGPLLCGEMGYELSLLDTEFGIQLTQATLQAVEAHHSSWCLWCYKDAHFMGLTYPAEQSGWMRLVRAVHTLWDHHRAAAIGHSAVDALESLLAYPLSEQEKYAMQFILRAMAGRADVTHILAPALANLPSEARQTLPDDFLLANCDRNISLEKLLKFTCAVADNS